jgi:hypothetical protein
MPNEHSDSPYRQILPMARFSDQKKIELNITICRWKRPLMLVLALGPKC